VGPGVLRVEIHHPKLYLLFITLNLADLVLTLIVMNYLGMREVHPAARWILLNFQTWGLAAYKLGLTGLVIVLAELVHRQRPRLSMGLMVFGSLLMTLVVAWSLGQMMQAMYMKPS
jgi:hypothetical protein